jgi:hypothetical protein
MKQKEINLQFPLGGLSKNFAYQNQPPYTTADCCNVRPRDVFEGRLRGGTRPGLGKAFRGTLLGSGSPIRMMQFVEMVQDDGFRFWTDYFQGTALSEVWSASSWITDTPDLLPADLTNGLEYEEETAMVRDAFSPTIDTGESYTIAMFIVPYNNAHHGEYRIYGRMDNTTPDATDEGFVANLVMTGEDGTYEGTLTEYNGGTPTSYDFTADETGTGYAEPGWFIAVVNGDNVKCYWNSNLLIDQDITTQTGLRIGMGMKCTVAGGITLVDTFRVQYYSTSAEPYNRTVLVASSGGNLYKETILGELEQVTTNATLASDRQLMAVSRGQKLYIADYGEPLIEGDSGVLAVSSSDTQLSKVGVTWNDKGISIYDHVLEITNADVSTEDGTYAIISIASGYITIDEELTSITCSYSVQRGPKVYDPVADTLTLHTVDNYDSGARKGTIPVGCRIIDLYRDRICYASSEDAPNAYYKSRSGDPNDFDYAPTDLSNDATRAVAGTPTDAGNIGKPLSVIASFTDDYQVMAGTNSLHVLRGDEAYSGQIDKISNTIGIISKTAWCEGPNGEFIFLSRKGLFYLPSDISTQPIPISMDKLPRDLKNIDVGNHNVLLAFDSEENGFHVYITPESGREGLHYWVSWETQGIFPVDLQSDHEPTAIISHYSESAIDTKTYLGCRDGYIRNYDKSNKKDDGSDISSYLLIGPIKASRGDYTEGILKELTAVFDEDSDDCTWELYFSQYPEGLMSSQALFTGTWVSGINYKVRQEGRGGCFAVKIKATSGRWAMENINLIAQESGPRHKNG